jgi:hypothetical protein
MSIAVLTPYRDGCLFELNGVTYPFGSYEEAEAEVLARGLMFTVERFPSIPVVHAQSPTLPVL